MARSVFAPLTVVGLALLVAFGCGGGGGNGGSSSGGDTSGGNTGAQAVLTLVGTSGAAANAPAQSLSDLVAGQSLIVRALSVERTGVGTYLEVDNLQVDAPAGVATVSPAFGTVVANGSSSSSYTISGTVNGRTVSAVLRVLPAASRVQVTGRVRTTANGNVAGATVSFYAAGETDELASTLTGPSGTYVAYVPTDAARFSVDATDLRTLAGSYLYYNTYAFGDLYYDATLGCPAPLPTLTTTTTLADAVFYAKTSGASVPSVPTGCVP